MRLMIVDDHPGVRKLIRQFVASTGDTVCECADGDEAIRKAFDFRPDAVTMDMRMPGTCGLTATRALRAVHPAARVVIVTSHDQPGLDRAASDAGAAGFVLKDNLAQLHDLIRISSESVEATPEPRPIPPSNAQALLTLMVDNNAADGELITAELLRCGFKPVIQRVDSADDLRRALELGTWDLMLTEFDLPGFSGAAALEILRESKTHVPAICVTGSFGTDSVRRILEAGAIACVDKNHPGPLAAAIKKALCVPAASGLKSSPTSPVPQSSPASPTVAQLLSRIGRLEDENRDLRAFACSIAHDLSAPLRRVRISVDQLQEDGSSTNDGSRKDVLWQRVAEGCRVLSARVEALLALARFESCPVQFETVSMNAVIEDALAEVCSDEQRARVELRIASLPEVWGDRALLQLAFANLLSNACKFTAHLPRPVIEIGRAVGNSEVTVFIKDNGLGFDMRSASRLFQPFSRLHSCEEMPGLGLGLATARRIVQRHHGRMNAESAVNHGAIFYCTLPTAAAPPESRPGRASHPSGTVADAAGSNPI